MLGKILIDKLRISISIHKLSEPRKVKEELDAIMSNHFRKENYTVNYDKSYFRVTFTPTLYLDDVIKNEDKPIFNLQMPENSMFLTLLQQIRAVLGDNATVTWIDIAKDIITCSEVTKYIQALSKLTPKYPYKKSEYISRGNLVTLTLSPHSKKNVTNCKNDNRKITYYSKTSEIRTKTKGKVRFIDNVILSDEEIELFSREEYKEMFDTENQRLYLDKLNILRCEQRYKYTSNIKRIVHCLTNSKEKDKLTLQLLIKLLEENKLYRELDKFYTEEIRKYVFYIDISKEKDIKLNKHEKIVKDCINKYDIDITDFQYLFEDLGLKNKFAYFMKKLLYCIVGEYYNELYVKYKI